MGSIGAEELLNRYGGYDQVAEAWLEGKLNILEQRYVTELVNKTDLEAARIRIELKRKDMYIKTVFLSFFMAGAGMDRRSSRYDDKEQEFEKLWEKTKGQIPGAS